MKNLKLKEFLSKSNKSFWGILRVASKLSLFYVIINYIVILSLGKIGRDYYFMEWLFNQKYSWSYGFNPIVNYFSILFGIFIILICINEVSEDNEKVNLFSLLSFGFIFGLILGLLTGKVLAYLIFFGFLGFVFWIISKFIEQNFFSVKTPINKFTEKFEEFLKKIILWIIK